MTGLIIVLAGSALGAMLFIVAWSVVALPRAGICLRLIFRSPNLWLVPGFAMLSVLWSKTPDVTFRAALEVSATIGIASLTTGFLRPREFVSAMVMSLIAGAVLSLTFGRYGMDGLTGATVFLGIFASKNTMALFMSLLVVFATAAMFDRDQPRLVRLLAASSFLFSIPLLLLAHSVGALLTTLGSLVVLLFTACFARLRSMERMMALTCVAILAVPLATLTVLLAINGTLGDEATTFITAVLGKDATLTGRTLLWRIALSEIDKRPLLGTGYYGFWLQGNPLAESIWRYFSIDSRMGFSFHNTFLEYAVELGWIGVATLAVTLVLAVERSVRFALSDRTPATASLVAIIYCLATRTIGEVDAPYPFAVGTFLLFVVAAYAADFAYMPRGAIGANTRLRAAWNLPAGQQPQIGT